jgi:hypothetical protein
MERLRIKDESPESFLEEHDDRLVVDLRDDVPLVAEALNKLSERVSFVLHHVG